MLFTVPFDIQIDPRLIVNDLLSFSPGQYFYDFPMFTQVMIHHGTIVSVKNLNCKLSCLKCHKQALITRPDFKSSTLLFIFISKRGDKQANSLLKYYFPTKVLFLSKY